jgi:hypothetical protein
MMNKFILELLDVGCMEEIFALVQWVVELVTNIPPGGAFLS